MTIWYTSDEHAGHEKIIQYVSRPFKNAEAYIESMIATHNARVSPLDHTWHLGDMFWKSLGLKRARDIFYALNGTHSIVLGNHDELITDNRRVWEQDFLEIVDLKEQKVSSRQKLILCHYAMRVWPGSHKGSWHLYGHSHGEIPTHGLSFDVGVDSKDHSEGYGPVSLEKVRELMERKKQHHIITKVWPGKEAYDHLPEGSS